MYTIAFAQWRLKFPNLIKYDEEEILEVIEAGFRRLYENPLEIVLSKNSIKIPKKFYKSYELEKCQRPYLINYFEQIGWEDPFKDEIINQSPPPDRKVPEDLLQWIYPDNKMVRGMMPFQMYIPNQIVMFKIMRSSICLCNEEDTM